MTKAQIMQAKEAYAALLGRIPRGQKALAYNDACQVETALNVMLGMRELLEDCRPLLESGARPGSPIFDRIDRALAEAP